jgi:hypothetical protein
MEKNRASASRAVSGGFMPTLQQKVAEHFLAKLMGGKSLDAEKIEQLRTLLADSKKPKAEDFIKIFTAPTGGDVK